MLQRRVRTRSADQVETPGLLHREYQWQDHRRGDRLRPAQTRDTAWFGKREGVCSRTWMAYSTDVTAEHCICLSYDIRQSNNYICQFHKSLHTQLGRSIKLNFFKNEKDKQKAGNKLQPFSLQNNAGNNSLLGKQQKQATWSRSIGT